MLNLILWIVVVFLVSIFAIIPLLYLIYYFLFDMYLYHQVGKKFRQEKEDVKRLIKHTGLIKDEATDWISHIILNNPNKNVSKLAFKIRSEGTEISTDEKISLNLHVNTKLSKKYLAALTDQGKINPLHGAENIARRYQNSKNKFELKKGSG